MRRALLLVGWLAGCSSYPNSGRGGNVNTGGAQDFAGFREALDHGQVPSTESLDASGFFAEHYTALPPPGCGQTLCLHGMLAVAPDLARGGDWTLLQMAMNTPIDPTTVQKPPLDLAVVLDHSGSMAESGKLEYAKQGVSLLIDALGDADIFTFIVFDDGVSTEFGPARVTDKAALHAIVDRIQPGGGTNIYGGLEAGYQAVLSQGDERQPRRVIFLTDGLATSGTTDGTSILQMSARYNQEYAGLTTIGLGGDADLTLLRLLSERGAGNFYFAEKPEAVQEIFTEELTYFVAPIAYDVDLSFEQQPGYSIDEVYGSTLWKATATGGTIHVPSVFLSSRTSPSPAPDTQGRRGGGSALIAELSGESTGDIARLNLSYRLPGESSLVTSELVIRAPATTPYYDDPVVEKNTIVLDFFVAFRDATMAAQTDREAAKTILTDFQPKITARLAGWADQDLLDDLRILQEYIDVLAHP